MIKSPMKYPGSKRLILDKVLRRIGSGNVLVEPFCGSCVVGFNADFDRVVFNDINQELIGIYQRLISEREAFIHELANMFTPAFNTREFFLSAREQFNRSTDKNERAALLFYLSRHCYNSLIRFNKGGGFNSPFGRYDKPYFPEKELLSFIEQCHRFVFTSTSFENVFLTLPASSTVYVDPPYCMATKTANFKSYQSGGFTDHQHVLLRDLCQESAQNGHHVVLSNHSTKFTRELYKDTKQYRFSVTRTISSKTSDRKPAAELLATFKDKLA